MLAYMAAHIVIDGRRTTLFGAAAAGSAAFLLECMALRAKTAEDRMLIELLDPIAETLGLDIVRVRLMGGTQRRRLQVMAERPSDHDISVEECARLSRAISEVLDAADPIAGEYLLEVSSPGIDRPLTRLIDFQLFEGHEARLETDRMVEGRRRFRGLLAGVEDADSANPMVAIDLEDDDDTALLPFAWLSEAKLILTDALLKRGEEIRRGRGEPEPDQIEDEA